MTRQMLPSMITTIDSPVLFEVRRMSNGARTAGKGRDPQRPPLSIFVFIIYCFRLSPREQTDARRVLSGMFMCVVLTTGG